MPRIIRIILVLAVVVGCSFSSSAAMRGRAYIDEQKMVRSDAGYPLRGCRFMINSNMTNSNPELFGTDSVEHREYFHTLAADFHLNCIRIIFKAYRWGQTNEFEDEYLPARTTEAIDAVVQYCEDEGIYAVLNYHEVGSLSLAQATQFWDVYAPRYKDRTHVLYELCNEPKKWGDGFSDDLVSDIESLYLYVDNLAPETFKICFTPSGVSSSIVTLMVEKATRIEYDNAAVGYHLYQGSVDDADAMPQAGYPAICTEIPSDTDEKTDYDKLIPFMRDLEDAGHGWLTWFPDANMNQSNRFTSAFLDSLSDHGIQPWPVDTVSPGVSTLLSTVPFYRAPVSRSENQYNALGRFRSPEREMRRDALPRKTLRNWEVIVR